MSSSSDVSATVRTFGALAAAFGTVEFEGPPTYMSVATTAAGCAFGAFGAGVAAATCSGALVAGCGAGATGAPGELTDPAVLDGVFALVVIVVVVVDFAAAFGFACAGVGVEAAVDATFNERAVAGIAAAGVADVLETVVETGVAETGAEVGVEAEEEVAATTATVFGCIAGEAFTAPAGGSTLAAAFAEVVVEVAVGAAAAARRAAAARATLASVGGAPGMGWAPDASPLAAGFGRLLSGR